MIKIIAFIVFYIVIGLWIAIRSFEEPEPENGLMIVLLWPFGVSIVIMLAALYPFFKLYEIIFRRYKKNAPTE